MDFTSLYPWVNKYAKYPIGHPTRYVGNDIPSRVEGLLKCKVLPPKDLYLPLLPYRARHKLLFPLCRSCADSGQETQCEHENPEDRAIVGTWVTCELEKACELGYVILEKYEALHYPNTAQYDPATRTGGLWSAFIDKWVALKQEASGYPSHCNSEEEREAYVKAYEQHEGIKLDPHRIARNEGLRSLAKLMANSHWGKFAQRSNKVQITYTDDPAEYIRLMSDPAINVHDVNYVNESYVSLSWNLDADHDEGSPKTNVVLAAYTTANARLKLYSVAGKLGQRALYMDTDSVIFIHRDGLYNPDLDDYLGGLKDEVPDNEIVEYLGLGPKNYALRMDDGSTVCKVRGFTLNQRASKLINFESMRQLVATGGGEGPSVVDPHAIVREGLGNIYTGQKEKKYGMVYDKRRLLADGVSTVPFGWRL